jgi:AraC-like DNA-binding protein
MPAATLRMKTCQSASVVTLDGLGTKTVSTAAIVCPILFLPTPVNIRRLYAMDNDPKTRIDSAPGIVTDLELMIGDVAGMLPFAVDRAPLVSRLGRHLTNLAELISRVRSYTEVSAAPDREPDVEVDFNEASKAAYVASRIAIIAHEEALIADGVCAILQAQQADNQPDGGDHDTAPEQARQSGDDVISGNRVRSIIPDEIEPVAAKEAAIKAEYLAACDEFYASPEMQEMVPTPLEPFRGLTAAEAIERLPDALKGAVENVAADGPEAPPQDTEALSAPAGTEEVEAGEVCGVEPPLAPAPKEHKPRYASSASQQALDLYATTTMTYAEIAQALGLAPATPKALVSKNRSEGDPRVAQGDTARQKVVDGESFVRGRRTEQALDLYATTTMTMAEIGRRCGFEFDVCRSVIRSKVQNRDPRALAGQKLRGETLPAKAVPEAVVPPPKPEPVIDMPAKAEIALDLYADTTITKTGIADRIGLPMAAVKDIFTDAKATGDTRVQKGDTARAAAIEALKAAPVLAASLQFATHGCIEIDEPAGMVRGPKGMKVFSKPQIRALKVLAKIPAGSYLDAQALAFRTQWGSPQAFVEQFPLVERPLADIGIELGRVGKNMFFIREAKA